MTKQTTESTSKEIVPQENLGRGLEERALLTLHFGTKVRIWGDSNPDATEPNIDQDKCEAVKSKNRYRCAFCGLKTDTLEIHNLDNNHVNNSDENLIAVDPICHEWHHLEQPSDAVIAYLPGLSKADGNHLQRTIAVALNSGNSELANAAKKIINWLASHKAYVANAWGKAYKANEFGAAIARTNSTDSEHEAILSNLHVVFNPVHFKKYSATWKQEMPSLNPEQWSQTFHKVMNTL